MESPSRVHAILVGTGAPPDARQVRSVPLPSCKTRSVGARIHTAEGLTRNWKKGRKQKFKFLDQKGIAFEIQTD